MCQTRRSSEIDYEAELAVVIGKTARHVPRERAFEYIFGYTCANDVSARDWQRVIIAANAVPPSRREQGRPAAHGRGLGTIVAGQELADTIAGFALFADLTTPQREQVVDVFSEQWFADGEKILRQGLSGSGLYVVLEGAAAIRIDGVDRATLRAGDYFGEISCLLGEAPTADIVALGALRCLVLASSQVESFLKANPNVMYRLLQGEARKVRTTTKWLS